MNHVGRNLNQARSGKRRLAGDTLVEHPTKREDITAPINLASHRLLRRQIGRCTDKGATLRLHDEKCLRLGFRDSDLLVVELFGKSEVEYFDLTSVVDHDVLRLDVTVNYASAVRFAQGRGHVLNNLQRQPQR